MTAEGFRRMPVAMEKTEVRSPFACTKLRDDKKIREVFPAVHGLRRLGEPPEVPAACQSLLQARARSAAYVKRSVHETAP